LAFLARRSALRRSFRLAVAAIIAVVVFAIRRRQEEAVGDSAALGRREGPSSEKLSNADGEEK
jgi:hypothetical protein